MNKKILINNLTLYGIVIYITIINVVTSFFLIESIDVILARRNIALIINLLINLVMVTLNAFFFRMKRHQEGFRLVLLFDSIYSLIYGIGVQVAGVIIVNYSGFNFSVFYIQKNGSSVGINYGSFNVVLKFLSYDNTANPGFAIYINLVMVLICVFLFWIYNSIRKSEKSVNGSVPK